MSDRELQDWIENSLNGTLTDEESRWLEERLLNDKAAREHYLKEANLHASLWRRFSSAGAPVESEEAVVAPFPSQVRRRRLVGVAAIACIVVFAAVMTWLVPSNGTIAMLAHVVGAYDDEGVAYVAGDPVEPGFLGVAKGVVRLDFSNGARLSIEGPAEVEVIDAMNVVLHRGVVTATIPEAAIGFVVDTPTAHVVDLGTSFGVSVSEAGLTDVYVFDGEVKVSARDGGKPVEVAHLLREGEAVRTDSESSSIGSVDFDPSQFEAAWPVNSGVLQTTGSIRFVSPGPNFHPSNYEDNEHIVVFPERRGFVPSEPIRVDMVDPGQYEKRRNEELPTLLPEQRLTSYLLQLNAYPEGERPNKRRGVRGQITFAKPIVGVVMANRLLKKSEEVFGLPGVEYPGARMIEPRPEGSTGKGYDTVILVADRRTLLIELQENPGNLDQFRVLVEAE